MASEYAILNKDNKVELVICPISTSNVSNFYLLSDEEKASFGYYPVFRESIEVQTEEEVKEEKVLRDNKVFITSYYKKSEPIFYEPNIEELRIQKVKDVKAKASEIILSKYPEYKQINASLGIYGEEYKITMISYINSIRAQVATYEEQISTATLDSINFEIIFTEN
jgi:hypothetical protein